MLVSNTDFKPNFEVTNLNLNKMSKNDDNEQLLKQALAVSSIPNDFDPNKIPETGEEYLHHVMYEAKRCKQWLKADISSDKLKNSQTLLINEPTPCQLPPESFTSTPEWQKHQVAHFSALRLHIQRLKSSTDEKPVEFIGDISFCKKKCQIEPKLSDLLTLQHKFLCKILNFIVVWLEEIEEGQSISYSLGSWLYAILSCLETPLMPEDCFVLREIARKCSEIRSKLDENSPEELYKPLNLFICIIVHYFNNNDLIDL